MDVGWDGHELRSEYLSEYSGVDGEEERRWRGGLSPPWTSVTLSPLLSVCQYHGGSAQTVSCLH